MCEHDPKFWSRRAFLKGGGLALITLGFGGGPGFLTRAAHAATTQPFVRRKVLVTIFQRGAMDALAAVAPLGEEVALAKLRPTLALGASRTTSDEERLIDLDGRFGLHPALGALAPLYRDGRLAIVHGVGSPDPTRSHFDAQDYMESGTPGRKGTTSGWLGRVSGLLGHEATPLQSVALTAALPRSLQGAQPAVAVARLDDLAVKLPGSSGAANTAGAGFESLWTATTQDLLGEAGRESFEAVELLEQARRTVPRSTAKYPRSPLGEALGQIAFLIKANVGLEIGFAESGGWDTHVRQGGSRGSFAQRARDLGESIAAFWEDLGTWQDDVVLMTMTEFGRTVAENGSGGTDHGHGSCLMVLGQGVDGGRVLGSVPRLRTEELFEGRDLPVTTDFRAAFAGVAVPWLGLREPSQLFPGWQGALLPLLRS
jgi:uncharacterized protein (DUF1501 family)